MLFRAASMVEIPRLGVESELQLPAYATATAMQDPSRVYDVHHSSQQQVIQATSDVPMPQQHMIQATSATYTTAHNSRSLTHWARPGIQPATSWFLVRFINHCATTRTQEVFFFLNRKHITCTDLLISLYFTHFILCISVRLILIKHRSSLLNPLLKNL